MGLISFRSWTFRLISVRDRHSLRLSLTYPKKAFSGNSTSKGPWSDIPYLPLAVSRRSGYGDIVVIYKCNLVQLRNIRTGTFSFSTYEAREVLQVSEPVKASAYHPVRNIYSRSSGRYCSISISITRLVDLWNLQIPIGNKLILQATCPDVNPLRWLYSSTSN